MNLRDLDARLVPRAAAALRQGLDALGQRTAAARQRVTGAGSRPDRAADRSGPLRRLDERYTRTGPLRLLRDVPQLGLLVAALVFLAGAGVALSLDDGTTTAAQQQVSGPDGLSLALGPAPGTEVEPHLQEAAERLEDVAEDDPDGRHVALVSLRQGLTPQATGALLADSGLELERGYLRADVPGRPEEVVFQTPGDVVRGLLDVFAATATRKAEEQRDLLTTAATIEGVSEQEREFRALYERDASTAGAEAAAYRTGCACVFALLVSGQAQSLAGLAEQAQVRGVELAPRGAAVAALDVRPLLPGATGTVPQEGS